MTIKIQELENLQDLTEIELEKIKGGQTLVGTDPRSDIAGATVGQLLAVLGRQELRNLGLELQELFS